MQQITNLIEWAKAERKKFFDTNEQYIKSEIICDYITDVLLPKLEGCKTSPNTDMNAICPDCGAELDIKVSVEFKRHHI